MTPDYTKLLEAMRERRSVRSYNGQPLSDAQRRELLATAVSTPSPFGGNVTVRLKQFDLKGPQSPGTYGTISGAADYFLVALEHEDKSALTTGYVFEAVVLKAWEMGLGTCWIAATFKGSDFDAGQTWPDNEQLTIISPVGIASKPSIREKMTRMMLGSKNRKPFGQLFFKDGFNTPLDPDDTFGEPLAMMRLAPSSTNSQPWRAVVKDGDVHFFYVPKSKASVLDCGIGLYHFDMTERALGHKGEFFTAPVDALATGDMRYLISYRRKL